MRETGKLKIMGKMLRVKKVEGNSYCLTNAAIFHGIECQNRNQLGEDKSEILFCTW